MKQLTIFFLLVFILQACNKDEFDQQNSGEEVVPSVEAVEARFGSLPLEERLSGVVSAQNQINIFPKISAQVEEVVIQNGETVEPGDLLVKLRDTEYRERLRQAKANLRINEARKKQAQASLNEVRSQLRRERVLAEQDLTSDLEIERLVAQLESAEANLDLAEAQIEQALAAVEEQREALSETKIRSPIKGTVGQRQVEPGMQVDTNTQLFTIGDLSNARITINLTERMLSYIDQGMSVRIYSEFIEDKVFTGTIARISPFLGAGNFSTEAEIEIDNNERKLLPGMFVTVDVLYGESDQATLVPISAIYRHPRTGETGVYVAPGFGIETEPIEQVDSANPPPLSNPTDVRFVPIQVVAQGREAAGVTGLQNGDWVITVGQNLLMDDRGNGTAKIRAVSWNRIMNLQNLQPQDLLKEIMEDIVERHDSSSSDKSQIQRL